MDKLRFWNPWRSGRMISRDVHFLLWGSSYSSPLLEIPPQVHLLRQSDLLLPMTHLAFSRSEQQLSSASLWSLDLLHFVSQICDASVLRTWLMLYPLGTEECPNGSWCCYNKVTSRDSKRSPGYNGMSEMGPQMSWLTAFATLLTSFPEMTRSPAYHSRSFLEEANQHPLSQTQCSP